MNAHTAPTAADLAAEVPSDTARILYTTPDGYRRVVLVVSALVDLYGGRRFGLQEHDPEGPTGWGSRGITASADEAAAWVAA